jgi:hypothetical protein
VSLAAERRTATFEIRLRADSEVFFHRRRKVGRSNSFFSKVNVSAYPLEAKRIVVSAKTAILGITEREGGQKMPVHAYAG